MVALRNWISALPVLGARGRETAGSLLWQEVLEELGSPSQLWEAPARWSVCISPFCLSASSLVEEYVGQRKEYLQNLFVCNNALITWWITLLFYHVSTINARWQRLFADLGLGCVICRVCRSWVRQRSQMLQWTNVAFPVSQIPFYLFLSMDSRSNFPQYLLFC